MIKFKKKSLKKEVNLHYLFKFMTLVTRSQAPYMKKLWILTPNKSNVQR
jgi:hypothetical protein